MERVQQGQGSNLNSNLIVIQRIFFTAEKENCKPSNRITCSVAFDYFVSHLTKLNINRKVSKNHFGSLLRLVLPQLRSKKRVSRGERGEKIIQGASSYFRAFREGRVILCSYEESTITKYIAIVFPTA